MPILNKGLVQLYTGRGKGKTTAAFGLAWRMLGAGGRVYICQFLKPADRSTGEAELARQFSDRLTLERLDQPWDMIASWDDPAQLDNMKQALAQKLRHIDRIARRGDYDLMILDEIVFCLAKNLIAWPDLLALIDNRAPTVELLLTGRDADRRLIDKADLVTDMTPLKHPWQSGVPARRGIEF